MSSLMTPEGYTSPLTIRETEVAIKEVKDFFERALAKSLHLTRVSAPLFVKPSTGLNDNLNGVERPVAFGIKEQDDDIAEIVHSLAKWKRYALKRYGFHSGEGLYTDMNAIRRDEDTDNLHSIYVDQWDWEKVISKEERNTETQTRTGSVSRKTRGKAAADRRRFPRFCWTPSCGGSKTARKTRKNRGMKQPIGHSMSEKDMRRKTA